MEGVYFVWSEIIVSPDEHIGWSTLSSVFEDVNFLGQLVKNEENYTITNIQIISTLGFIQYEYEKEGILKDIPLRGGEIKKLTNGGGCNFGGGRELLFSKICISKFSRRRKLFFNSLSWI